MSPEDSGEFGRYCQYRFQGEDEVCTRLRMRLSETTAREYEADLKRIREGNPA